MNESILLEGFLKFIGDKSYFVEEDGTVWKNAFMNGTKVDAVSEYLQSEAIKKWEDSSKDIIDAEKVLSKHASNYAKTVEKDEKPLYFLQLNGHEAINAMKEYASQFQPIVGELLKVYQAIKMTGANIRPLKIINERISELEKIINHGK